MHKESALNLAQAYLFTHRPLEALRMLLVLQNKYRHDDRLDYYHLAYIKQGNSLDAHRTIDRIISDDGHETKHFLFHFLKAKLLVGNNDLTAAATHVEKALLQNPRFAKAVILKGVIATQ